MLKKKSQPSMAEVAHLVTHFVGGINGLRNEFWNCPYDFVRIGYLKVLEEGHHGFGIRTKTLPKLQFYLEVAEGLAKNPMRLHVPETAKLMSNALRLAADCFAGVGHRDYPTEAAHLLDVIAKPEAVNASVLVEPVKAKLKQFLATYHESFRRAPATQALWWNALWNLGFDAELVVYDFDVDFAVSFLAGKIRDAYDGEHDHLNLGKVWNAAVLGEDVSLQGWISYFIQLMVRAGKIPMSADWLYLTSDGPTTIPLHSDSEYVAH